MAARLTKEKRAERRAKQIWITFVVMLLGLQLTIGAIAIRLATADRSAAVVPDYHNAALNWDADRESRSLIQRLQWDFRLELSDITDSSGNRAVRAVVIDQTGQNQTGQGVNDLDLTMTAYHHSHGRDFITVDLQPIGNGQYQCLAPIAISGLWDFDFVFDVDGKPARVIRTLEVR